MTATNHLDQATHGSSRTPRRRYKMTATNHLDQATHGSSRTPRRRYNNGAAI
jgi:hypothetical protein